MQRKFRINAHSHLLPYPEEIPQFLKDNQIFWVDEDRKYMLQKGCCLLYTSDAADE